MRRPDWKGAERIIRRCVLLEYSVCSLPMNPQALVAAVNKGVHRPVFSPPPPPPQAPSILDAASPPDVSAGQAVENKSGVTVSAPADPPTAGSGTAEEDLATSASASPSESDHAPNDVEKADVDVEEAGGFQRFDHVQVTASHYNGVGRIESFSTRGHVPDVAEDMLGTADNPAARIQCYKAMGDGHLPTCDHIAARLANLTKLAEPMRPPSQIKLAKGTQMTSRTRSADPLPQVVVQSDQEVRAELIAKLNEMLSPDGFRRIAREEAERAAGFV
ncbi:hypothetical protein V5E97_10240 [Singulisphaera sp. Ch08]|uniref:Uncharacterized protein n=1 Tax=Singulisphaera sp. Ch08 TaxID=3120278 RepID=A0AAU7CMV0_9BACT